jgi:hypothetical protein
MARQFSFTCIVLSLSRHWPQIQRIPPRAHTRTRSIRRLKPRARMLDRFAICIGGTQTKWYTCGKLGRSCLPVLWVGFCDSLLNYWLITSTQLILGLTVLKAPRSSFATTAMDELNSLCDTYAAAAKKGGRAARALVRKLKPRAGRTY